MINSILKEIEKLEYEFEHTKLSATEKQIKIDLIRDKKHEVESLSKKESIIIPGSNIPTVKDRKKEKSSKFSSNRVRLF